MEFTEFVRRPFKVEAVRITAENIDEIAALIGEVKIHNKTKEKFILLDKRIVPSMARAFVGWWVTRFNDNLRVYSHKIFQEQFMECDEQWQVWFELAEGDIEAEVAEENQAAADIDVPADSAVAKLLDV